MKTYTYEVIAASGKIGTFSTFEDAVEALNGQRGIITEYLNGRWKSIIHCN